MRTTTDRLQRVPVEIAELATRSLPLERFVEEACERLRHAMPFDYYCLRFCDPATSVPSGAVSSFDCASAPISYRHEYSGGDFASLPRLRDGGQRVAILSEATGGVLSRSGRWRDVLEPFGVPYELTGLATRGERVWGQVILLRESPSGDFGPREAEALSRSLAPIADGIRSAYLPPMTAPATVAHDRSPAVIMLDGANRVAESTPLPDAWLEALHPMPELYTPLALQAVAEVARGEAHRSALTRLRNPDGGWLTVHATAMGTERERVAVVVQPARAGEVAQLMLASLNLTDGEHAVVERVMQGRSTKQMAAELYLSPHTVQDRLKSIFAKLGVRSRREVVALLEQRLPA